jgi:hypothetical protein
MIVFCMFQSKLEKHINDIVSHSEEDNNPTNLTSSSSEDTVKLLYEYFSAWSHWSRCSRRCEKSRVRRCRNVEYCGKSWLTEKRTCKKRTGRCSTMSYKVIGFRRRHRLIEELIYDLLYSPWSPWGACTRSCKKRRLRKCEIPRICGKSYIQEDKRCRVPRSSCERRYILNTLEPPPDNDTETDASLTQPPADPTGKSAS